MKINRIIIFCIVLTVLLMGAVSAVENTSDDTDNIIEDTATGYDKFISSKKL